MQDVNPIRSPQFICSGALIAALYCGAVWPPDRAVADPPKLPAQSNRPVSDLSLRLEVERAIDKGVAWLEKAQSAEGYWSSPDHPALSGLALVALQGDPSKASRVEKSRPDVLAKGYAYLLRCVQPDGGIYAKKELINYNTSVGVLALALANRTDYDPIIKKARQQIIAGQWDFDQQGKTDNPLDGGIGYGSSYPHSDLANTMHALEALYFSRRVAADKGQTGERDLNWDAAIQFIQNCQHVPKYNKQPWVSEDPQNAGGFVYFPGESKAGDVTLPNGRTALRSYGSISYAGMLSYVYAGLKPDDPRVQAVLEWAQKNYTLEENPGMGPQGLFFYFHTMAKALSTSGVETLETKDGKKHDWRKELSLRLIDLQKAEGSWANESGRWWEKDPVLVTSYSLIALEMIHRAL
ncbi:MAG: terpene cyclase/mutase family protein [Verrucomicrobiales bacterium]|nr:terpene cyclase/mutase family protein [Verrucomicrobiales bacterium]